MTTIAIKQKNLILDSLSFGMEYLKTRPEKRAISKPIRKMIKLTTILISQTYKLFKDKLLPYVIYIIEMMQNIS